MAALPVASDEATKASEGGQSIERKEAYAAAYAAVLKANGIDAYPNSRLD